MDRKGFLGALGAMVAAPLAILRGEGPEPGDRDVSVTTGTGATWSSSLEVTGNHPTPTRPYRKAVDVWWREVFDGLASNDRPTR